LVAHTGFEPVISSLRGRCPRPLDECATRTYTSKNSQKFTISEAKSSQLVFTQGLFTKFLEARPSGISPRSIEAYHYTLKGFIGKPVTSQAISAYLNSLSCDNGRLKFYSCLRALCNWLYLNDYLADNPIKRVAKPRIKERILSAISKEQLSILLENCHSERDKAFILLLWYSGMRLSEAINAKASDFNWKKGTVTILGKGNKYRKALAGNGPVRKWFAEHDSFELNKGGAQTMLKRLTAETGIQCNAHAFRRGFAVHQVKSGLSTRVVQALGGWETIAMVERYSKSLDFDDALQLYKQVNGGEAFTYRAPSMPLESPLKCLWHDCRNYLNDTLE
jgi:site-specific recombinase XerD